MGNLSEIAALAQVSVSTVSRCLAGSTSIKSETKEKILAVARDLNYFSLKKNLVKLQSTKTIGIICPEISNNYYTKLINAVEEKVRENDYALLVGLTNHQYENEVYYLEIFEQKQVDGIIYITSVDLRSEDALYDFKNKSEIPVMQISTGGVEADIYNSIKIDVLYGVSLAIDHLVGLGHKDISYIGDMFSNRFSQFLESVKKHGLKINDDWIINGTDRFEEAGYKYMNTILSLKNQPSAIITAYDTIAIGAMRKIFELGYKIPENYSIVGVDDINVSSFLYKQLTTVSSPVCEMGSIAAKLLIEKIENKQDKIIQHISLKPEFIIRETTSRKESKSEIDAGQNDYSDNYKKIEGTKE